MTGVYERCLLPPLIALAMRNKQLQPYRRRVAAAASGRVLEVGIGSGLNLPFYGPQVSALLGLDPLSRLLARSAAAADRLGRPLELLQGSAEQLPLERRSIDTVVMTWTACSIPDAPAALAEMRRVLKPGGRLLFVEHGRAPEPGVARWQDRLTPLWRRIAGGCHLNRSIDRLVQDGGFRLDRLETGYIAGPKPMTFLYEGSATPR